MSSKVTRSTWLLSYLISDSLRRSIFSASEPHCLRLLPPLTCPKMASFGRNCAMEVKSNSPLQPIARSSSKRWSTRWWLLSLSSVQRSMKSCCIPICLLSWWIKTNLLITKRPRCLWIIDSKVISTTKTVIQIQIKTQSAALSQTVSQNLRMSPISIGCWIRHTSRMLMIRTRLRTSRRHHSLRWSLSRLLTRRRR